MKRTRILALLCTLAVAFGLLAGCSGTGGSPSSSSAASRPTSSFSSLPVSSEDGSEAEAGATVTDMMGRTVTLPEVVERVVALSAADCEIIYALGAGGLLVARGDYCDWPVEVLELPALGSGTDTNVEEIIALEPQVVFMASMAQAAGQVEQLEAAGIAVVVSEAYDIAGTYESITLIGACLGRNGEAAALVADMEDGFEALAAAVPADDAGYTVYFEVSPLEYGLWAAGDGSFMNEIGQMLGLENIFADMPAWAEISQEQVIERDPDIIITTMMYFGEGETPVEEILGRAGWEGIAAVREGRVFPVGANNEMARPGPRLLDAAREMAQLVYGETLDAAA